MTINQPVPGRRRLILGAGLAGAAAGAGLWALSGPGGRAFDGRGRAAPVRTEAQPPASADVVIIGGGLIGITTAFHLAARGLSVVVCEKGEVAGEASGRAVGQVVSGGLAPEKLPLIRYAKQEWAGLNAAVGGDTGYRRNGYVSVATNQEQLAFWESWLASAREFEPEGRMLSASQVQQLVGPGPFVGGYFNPDDGGVEPTMAAPAIAEGAKRRGVKIIAPCAVRVVETSGGKVSGVVTEKGSVRTDRVVLAGGCWSSMFARNLGLHLPGLNVFSMVRSVYQVQGPPGTGDLPTVSWRKQVDGGYTISVVGGVAPIVPATFRLGPEYWQALREAHWDVRLDFSSYFFEQLGVPSSWRSDEVSPFERLRVLEPTRNEPISTQAVVDIKKFLPPFERMALGAEWGGALVVTPDNMPTMSSVAAIPGLFLATGFTYGMTMGTAAGAIMADLVTDKTPHIDVKPYRYERYIDGSTLRFLP